MPKAADIPFSRMQKISPSGVFVKHFGQFGKTVMRPYAHRDDYYIAVLLTEGSADVEVDFERKELKPGDLLIISPWQVHNKPADAVWDADGWLLAFSPELLSESDDRAIEEYSISAQPFNPGESAVADITALFYMLERNLNNDAVTASLAAAVKSFVISSLPNPGNETSGRYTTITLKLRKLLDQHLTTEKSPAAYASMLNITEVYLNEAVKGTTGLSVGAYIRSKIIIRAKRQLAYASLSVQEIAYSLGYEDHTYFSKLFKKNTGISPAEYRKNLK